MYPFWQTIIKPILMASEPKTIVEIGSEEGKNTANLLEYCRERGATLHAIDPAPKFDVEAWEGRHAGRLVVHRGLSVDILPKLDRFDSVFIDGDHNWYTVFTELQLIDRRSAELDAPFPLTLLHDVGWPYGRRDLYYDPATIPAPYRLPYQRKGMAPNVSALLEQGGLNAGLNNAVREHGPRNGVLTAIEDFVRETKRTLDLITIPGFCGLGILYEPALRERNATLSRLIKDFILPPLLHQYLELLESTRIHQMFRRTIQS